MLHSPPDFAVPYAAPRLAKTSAEVTPMNPKNADEGSHGCMAGSVKGSSHKIAWSHEARAKIC